MLDAHFEVAAGLAGIAQLDARMQALLQRRLDGLRLGRHHVGMAVLAGLADAHGKVRAAELHHVDARHRQDGVEIVHARLLLDHDGDHDVVQRVDIGRRAALAHDADVATHADAEKAAAAHARGHGRLGAHGVDGGLGILDRADVGEQHALEARADRAHRLVGVLRLLDLDHAAHARELEGAAEIVEIVQVERRVLGGELDIVVLLGVTDQLDQRRPRRKNMRADGRLAGVQAFTKQVAAHDVSPLWLARIVRDRLRRGKREAVF